MIVHTEISRFKAKFPVVTVGIFDGVHLGHRYILQQLQKIADHHAGETVIVTLWPHPRTVLDQENIDFGMLTTREEKIRILESAGIKHLVIIPFTLEFSKMTSCEFIEKILIGNIGLGRLVVGYNHRFGRDRQGDYSELKKCAERFGFDIDKLEAYQLGGTRGSSSGIRELLQGGNVKEAARLLGRDYSFSGKVVGGSRLGRSIGFPTANITEGDPVKLLPSGGVYAVQAELRGRTYKGMMNMGSRPTVNPDEEKKTNEVHLLDFDEDIYSEEISIHFRARIRDEKKFDDIEALKSMLEKDRRETIRIFNFL